MSYTSNILNKIYFYFLEEAENERMHLLTALVLRKPGPLFKFAVIGAQGT